MATQHHARQKVHPRGRPGTEEIRGRERPRPAHPRKRIPARKRPMDADEAQLYDPERWDGMS